MPRPVSLAALAALLGCATLGRRADVDSRTASAAELAAAALDGWQLPRRDRLLAEAAAKDATDPLVETALLLRARAQLDDRKELDLALALLAQHPERPEARVASTALARLAGTSTREDQRILLASACLDLSRADPVVAQRVRELRAELLIARNEAEPAQALREEEGVVQSWRLVGPLSPWHWLDFDHPLGPELNAAADSFAAPWGREAWRSVRFFNGWIPVGHDIESRRPPAGENRPAPPSGDVFYAEAEVTAGAGGLLLRVEANASVAVFVDGRKVWIRDAFRRQRPRAAWLLVPVPAGSHQLLVKAAAGDPSAGFRAVALPAPAGTGTPDDAEALAARLAPEVGPAAAAALASEDARVDDIALALRLADRAEPSPIALSVRADLWGSLGTIGEEEARGRARRDLDSLLTLDPGDGSARLRRAGLELDLGQHDAATADLRAIAGPPTPRLSTARARLRIAEESQALALDPLRQALEQDPGYCPALELTYGLLDQADAFARLEETAEALARCPGGQATLAQFRSRRSGPASLVRYWRGRLDRSPADPRAAEELAEAQVTAGRLDAAADALRRRLDAWPEDIDGWRHLGALRSLAGDRRGARKAYERALALDPADLPLRRTLALQDGHDVLDGVLPQAAEALAGKVWTGPARAPMTTILDSGAAWLHSDGSVTERVRTVERILDESGLTQAGELALPAGAIPVALRTHKRDGRVLDAETMGSGEKNTLSAAALEVGDDLEIDYLISTPPSRRGAGGAAEPFYFEASDTSLQHSLYVVRDDRRPELDLHRLEAPAAGPWKGSLTFERREVPALVDEPGSPPATEYYPWVQAGHGDTLQDLARSVADQLASRLVADEGIRGLAAEVKGLGPRERAAALWSLLCARIRGNGAGIEDAASVVVARGSGDRLLPMKAALEQLGIRSRIVLASAPQASSEPRRFPALADYTDALLRIEPDGGPPLWLAPGLRWAPFDRLPTWLCGRPALELPEGDEDGRAFTLPGCPASAAGAPGTDDHRFRFALTLHGDGSLEGDGRETLGGFEAALARASLEQLDDAQRQQAVEAALASGFRGATLANATFEVGAAPGDEVTLRYHFAVDQIARPEGPRSWSIPLRGFPLHLADSYLQLAARDLPLLVPAWQRPAVELTVELPAEAKVTSDAPAPVALDTPFGSYRRVETRVGRKVELQERLVLPPQRIPPGQYAEFAAFAASVDRAEDERLTFSLPQ
ncbi:MAG: hypothetical protein ACYDCL_12210 [Myxococcales bacterium]